MYRQLLTFLLVWPLLLPQGVCVCDWFGADCHACDVGEAETHHDDEATVLPGHTCHRHIPVGHDSEHHPGCPAKSGYGRWRIVTAERPAPMTEAIALDPTVAEWRCPSCPSAAVRPIGLSRSLFLTLLNLRI